jgi:GAF domain-containing protein
VINPNFCDGLVDCAPMTAAFQQLVLDKPALYQELAQQVEEVVRGLDDEIATMASAVALIHNALPYASWTGFYRVADEALLRIGPYQGPLGCLEIPFGSGVCGTVAAEKRSLVVSDVHAFPGHIACDSAARSEVVVPVYGRDGALVAVLDLDSHSPSAFDDDDRTGLEAIAEILSRQL